MKKTQYTEAQLNEITAIQEERSITRKSAIRIFEKGNRRIILTAANKKAAPVVSTPTPNPTPITVVAKADSATTALPDVKMRAANDDTVASSQPAKATPAPLSMLGLPGKAAGDARQGRHSPVRHGWQAEEGRLYSRVRPDGSQVDVDRSRKGGRLEHR